MQRPKAFAVGRRTLPLAFTIAALFGTAATAAAQSADASRASIVTLTARDGHTTRLSSYGEGIVRIQHRFGTAPFLDDRHYAAVLPDRMGGTLTLRDAGTAWTIVALSGLRIDVAKADATVQVVRGADPLLAEAGAAWRRDGRMGQAFRYRAGERFFGFGQAPLGNTDRLEVTGETVRRNYGEDPVPTRGAQGNLLVPFYISQRGYGIFYNTTFPNDMAFGARGRYAAQFDVGAEPAEIDYFVFDAPRPAALIERYTWLTGRPILPPRWAFGLQLSDNEPEVQGLVDAAWWRTQVERHYAAGFPLDHLVFDNDWRQGSGAWSGSSFAFSGERWPHPEAFAAWYRPLGLSVTLDLNMNVAKNSDGWKPAFNLPVAGGCPDQHADSYPDYSNPATARWVWRLFWTKALDPALHYPGEALWMDETDAVRTGPGCVLDSARVHDGRTWLETRNVYYLQVAQAVVERGWLPHMRLQRDGRTYVPRPYVWLRGGSAGGQRLGLHWTGDLLQDQDSMHGQLLAMQQSGLAGYPYFNHDAGGFMPLKPFAENTGFDREKVNLTDNTYVQWAMAFGSFTPIWRPHGLFSPRWPASRSPQVQQWATFYARFRYESMPYIYGAAVDAALTGMPMARAMLLSYPDSERAWQSPDQYMWGGDILVAPATTLSGSPETKTVWLPPEKRWYGLWDDRGYDGDQVIRYATKFGYIPAFVRAGAILPKYDYARSTAKQDRAHLTLDVYSGSDGGYVLTEDDGYSMDYRDGAIARTRFRYIEGAAGRRLTIDATTGTYRGAPVARRYTVRLHGLARAPGAMRVGGHPCALQWDAKTQVARCDFQAATTVATAIDIAD